MAKLVLIGALTLALSTATIALASDKPLTPEAAKAAATCLLNIDQKENERAETRLKAHGKNPLSPEEAKAERVKADEEYLAQDRAVQNCITQEIAHALGEYSFYEDVWVPKCRLRSKASNRVINQAAMYELQSKGVDQSAFFKGQNWARERASGVKAGVLDARDLCKEILEDFGSKGAKFPDLVTR